MTTRTTTKTLTKKNTKTTLAKKGAALKKNALKNGAKNLKLGKKKITGLVNDIIGKTEDTINEIVVEAKRRLR